MYVCMQVCTHVLIFDGWMRLGMLTSVLHVCIRMYKLAQCKFLKYFFI